MKTRWIPGLALFALIVAAGVAHDVPGSTTQPAGAATPPTPVVRWHGPVRASSFGPGLYGRHTFCGQTLRPTTRGVAHRTMPCGARVLIRYRGQIVRATVIDKGPAAWTGRTFDLTEATVKQFGVSSSRSWGDRPVRWARCYRGGDGWRNCG